MYKRLSPSIKLEPTKKSDIKVDVTKKIFQISIKFLFNKRVCLLLICTVRNYMEATR